MSSADSTRMTKRIGIIGSVADNGAFICPGPSTEMLGAARVVALSYPPRLSVMEAPPSVGLVE